MTDKEKRDIINEIPLENTTTVPNVHSYNNSNNLLRIPQIPSSTIIKKIERGEYSTKLKKQQFFKHIEGTKQYEDYMESRLNKNGNPQSKITISLEEVQKIIVEKSGTGIVDTTKAGKPRNVEFITADVIVGYYYGGGEYHQTNKAAIHYGKTGAHLVPIKGDFYD